MIFGEGSPVVFSFCRTGSAERNQIVVYGMIHGVINVLFSWLYIYLSSPLAPSTKQDHRSPWLYPNHPTPKS